ncbi:MAG: hypothetical protein UV05_C0008G0010 [candidate division CPR1 bacterium GW2011_GWA2_42_17]|uniref:Uncharacterized protein n=1 Tax=candidate division CPR1 bacterium GW2011_GWA2_42_17 TaxID=1618341 RepID=A0A0G1BD45_9BACT|nr:MAG: hypothetical protein UV05_C0008G0010 [candidate division CPR1 bacterium GW2011_GWA2_42_17]
MNAKFRLFVVFVLGSAIFTSLATSSFRPGRAVAFGLMAIVCGIDSVLEKQKNG